MESTGFPPQVRFPISRQIDFTGTVIAVLLSLFSVISATQSFAAPPGDTDGRHLAEMVYDRLDGKDTSIHAIMSLTDPGGDARVRDMYIYRLKKKPGETRSLIRFASPATIEGTGLLTLDEPSGEPEQWVYLPALDRERRISSTRKGGRFVGSDFYYEDIRDRKVGADRHRIIGKEKIGGVACDVLESVPVDGDNSVYSKRVSWVDPQTYIALRIDFYEGDDTPAKRLIVNRVEKIQGYYTVVDSTMTDLHSGHETRVIIKNVMYDRKLPDGLFTRHALTDTEFEARFRP
jgi:hypothetical protein